MASGTTRILAIRPTNNFPLASNIDREDSAVTFAGRLKGLNHSLQIVSRIRAVEGLHPEWKQPPRLERSWLAASAHNRAYKLQESLEAMGLLCAPCEPEPASPIAGEPTRTHVMAEDGYLYTTLVLKRWPREVVAGWLGQALLDIECDVAIHLEAKDPTTFARFLKNQQSWQSTTNDAGDVIGAGDAERVRMKLVAKTDRPIRVAIVFRVRGVTQEELDEKVENLIYEIGLTQGQACVAVGEQDLGYYAVEPGGAMALRGAWQTLDCISVASTWPFQPASINHKNGAPIGTTNGMLFQLDPFDESLESFGMVVVAKVGAGKSYLNKVICEHLPGVEVRIVEQRSPSEYADINNVRILNLAAYEDIEARAQALSEYVDELWADAKRNPRPILLVLDELWSLLKYYKLAAKVQELARIGRHHWLSVCIATQQIEELLKSEDGLAVLNNAAIRVYLKQHGPDGEQLAEKMHLSAVARRLLRSMVRGQAIFDVAGMQMLVDIQANPDEHARYGTDPRERKARGLDSSPGEAAAPGSIGLLPGHLDSGNSASRSDLVGAVSQ